MVVETVVMIQLSSTHESASRSIYSTVTDFARLRGWSTSWPLAIAISEANTCSGTVATSGCNSVGVGGNTDQIVGVGRHGLVPFFREYDRARPAGPYLLDVAHDLVVQHSATPRRQDDDDDREARLDQGDRTVLQLCGREALGVHVGELLQQARLRARPDSPRAGRGTAPSEHRQRPGEARTGSVVSNTASPFPASAMAGR